MRSTYWFVTNSPLADKCLLRVCNTVRLLLKLVPRIFSSQWCFFYVFDINIYWAAPYQIGIAYIEAAKNYGCIFHWVKLRVMNGRMCELDESTVGLSQSHTYYPHITTHLWHWSRTKPHHLTRGICISAGHIEVIKKLDWFISERIKTDFFVNFKPE